MNIQLSTHEKTHMFNYMPPSKVTANSDLPQFLVAVTLAEALYLGNIKPPAEFTIYVDSATHDNIFQSSPSQASPLRSASESVPTEPSLLVNQRGDITASDPEVNDDFCDHIFDPNCSRCLGYSHCYSDDEDVADRGDERGEPDVDSPQVTALAKRFSAPIRLSLPQPTYPPLAESFVPSSDLKDFDQHQSPGVEELKRRLEDHLTVPKCTRKMGHLKYHTWILAHSKEERESFIELRRHLVITRIKSGAYVEIKYPYNVIWSQGREAQGCYFLKPDVTPQAHNMYLFSELAMMFHGWRVGKPYFSWSPLPPPIPKEKFWV